jgi:hypothetical protein
VGKDQHKFSPLGPMFKTRLFLSLVYSGVLCAAAEVPDDLRREATDLITLLRSAQTGRDLSTASYFERLATLGMKVDEGLKRDLQFQHPVDEVHALLALAAIYPDVADQISELSMWYGRYQAEIPRELKEKRWKSLIDAGIKPAALEDPLHYQKKKIQKVERLHDEHAVEQYRRAWETWLLAPPSKERAFMLPRIHEALMKINNPQSIAFLLESFRAETERLSIEKEKAQVGLNVMNVIRCIQGEKALDAVLECNRIAMANGFAGEGVGSFRRNIVRMLSSRRFYADLHPEEAGVPRADTKWKIYKPLIEQRLAQSKEMPKGDRELLQEALKEMPK